MHRVWGKPDKNQAEIVKALEEAGCRVQSLAAIGGGCPDLLAVSPPGYLFLVEVKGPKGTLTPAQVKWRSKWLSPVYVVRTPEDAVAVVCLLKASATLRRPPFGMIPTLQG